MKKVEERRASPYRVVALGGGKGLSYGISGIETDHAFRGVGEAIFVGIGGDFRFIARRAAKARQRSSGEANHSMLSMSVGDPRVPRLSSCAGLTCSGSTAVAR